MQYVAIASFKSMDGLEVFGPFVDQESAADYADFLADANKDDPDLEWTTVAEINVPTGEFLSKIA